MVFLALILLSSASQAAEPANPCQRLYNGIVAFGKKEANLLATSFGNVREDAKANGAKFWAVRLRTDAENHSSKLQHFFPEFHPAPADAGLLKKTLSRFRRLFTFKLPFGYSDGKRHSLSLLGGVVDSLDHAFLDHIDHGHLTARAGVKMAAMGGLGFVGFRYAYDLPFAAKIESSKFENEVIYDLDNEYAFRNLRNQVHKKQKTREEALEFVRQELDNRGKYFELVRQSLESEPGADPDEKLKTLADGFLPILNTPELKLIFADLNYYRSEEFRKNPKYKWHKLANPMTEEEEFQQLFLKNHLKVFTFASLPEWLKPGFDAEALKRDNPTDYLIYQNAIDDPFVKELIDYRKSNHISQETLVALVTEDFEWKNRFDTLQQLGAEVKGPKGSAFTLNEERRYFLWNNNLSQMEH